MPQLENRTIWLTGASSGIGEALAHQLARIPCRLAISARRGEVLEKLAAELSAENNTVRPYPLDVTDREAVPATAEKIAADLGPIDILIANAGTYKPDDPARFDAADYDGTMRLNFSGAVYCIEAVLPSMIERRSGYIVGVSSLVGYRGLPRASAYGASKAALINFLEGLRFDLRRHNVRVSVVNPGFVKTPLTDKNDFQMPFLMPVDEAAKVMMKGMRRGKMEIYFPWQLAWIFKLMRVIPYPLYDRLVRGRTGH